MITGGQTMLDSTALKAEISRLKRVADRSAKVVVVDDQQTMRLLLSQAIKGAGFVEVDKAQDGKSGLELMRKVSCDLALVDWNMPRMNGLELLNRVRADADIGNLVFVMVTAETMDQKVIQAAEEKQDAYLTKPISPEKLSRRLALILERRLTTAKARLFEAKGQVEKAVEEYMAAAHNRPRATWPLFALGDLLTRNGRYAEAERCFQKVLDLDPEAVAASLGLGRILEEKGDKQAARKVYQQAMAKNPRFFRAYDALADSLLEDGMDDKALRVLQGAMQAQGGENAGRRALMGRLFYEAERYAEAEESYAKCLELNSAPDKAETGLSLARSRLAQGRIDEAIPVLLAAVEASGEKGEDLAKLDAMMLLGAAHLHGGDQDSAEKVFSEIASPKNWGGRLPFKANGLEREVGGICFEAGRDDLGKEHVAQSIRLDPDDAENLELLKEMCEELGQEEIVHRQVAEVGKERDGRVELHSKNGLELVRKGQFALAEEEYAKALEADPKAGRVYFNLARLLLRMKRQDEALKAMTAAARFGLLRRDWMVVAEAAKFFAAQGRKDQASALLGKVLEAEPNEPNALKAIAEVEAAARAGRG